MWIVRKVIIVIYWPVDVSSWWIRDRTIVCSSVHQCKSHLDPFFSSVTLERHGIPLSSLILHLLTYVESGMMSLQGDVCR